MSKDTKTEDAPVDGMISLGYEQEDYCNPVDPETDEVPTKTVYPTLRVCNEPAAKLHEVLSGAKLLSGDFAAIVVLKNTMVRVADSDEDEDPTKDVEMEFTIKGIMPHFEPGAQTEDDIMAAFDKLPVVKSVSGDDGDNENDDEE